MWVALFVRVGWCLVAAILDWHIRYKFFINCDILKSRLLIKGNRSISHKLLLRFTCLVFLRARVLVPNRPIKLHFRTVNSRIIYFIQVIGEIINVKLSVPPLPLLCATSATPIHHRWSGRQRRRRSVIDRLFWSWSRQKFRIRGWNALISISHSRGNNFATGHLRWEVIHIYFAICFCTLRWNS